MFRNLNAPGASELAAWLSRELNALRQELNRKEVIALKDGATININAALGSDFRVTLGGNRTFAKPTGLHNGQRLTIRILQDGIGGRTWTPNAAYKFEGGAVPALSLAASAKDLLECQYDAADDTLFCWLRKDFR